ncbi:cation:proton antiporter domain-containing protein [Weissella cibaria]|uniref:cation:proton antiporter domain-containing protein n=1 Tax=Weissella cibaria TaxID=137591 RepID=UPI0021BD7EB2|nr:cation:proton antiporter [Weissella cibaria]
MELLQTIVGLTSLVVIGNILSHFLKRVPVSLIQISLGLLAALFLNVHIELDTEWFLLLFIAPLLYSDAWRFPKRELWELRGAIFGNAILLVFLTTILGALLFMDSSQSYRCRSHLRLPRYCHQLTQLL